MQPTAQVYLYIYIILQYGDVGHIVFCGVVRVVLLCCLRLSRTHAGGTR
jgi:hypothetical protein